MLSPLNRIDWRPWIVIALAPFALVGCGPTYVVRGTVTYKGAPVEGARVALSPQTAGGAAVATKTDQGGNFELRKGVTAGDYVVVVNKTIVKQPDPPTETKDGAAQAAPPMGAPPANFPTYAQVLPGRYGDPTTSPFRCTVPVGEPLRLELSD